MSQVLFTDSLAILRNLCEVAGARALTHTKVRNMRVAGMDPTLALSVALLTIRPWAFGTTLTVLAISSFMMQIGVQGAFGVVCW